MTPTEEHEKESIRIKFIASQLRTEADKQRGTEQDLYYARSGQYGKEKYVLVFNNGKAEWLDPAAWPVDPKIRLIIRERSHILVEWANETAVAHSYIVFKRTYKPTWNVGEEEALVIYQRPNK